jgi:hypothetical protein
MSAAQRPTTARAPSASRRLAAILEPMLEPPRPEPDLAAGQSAGGPGPPAHPDGGQRTVSSARSRTSRDEPPA